MAIQSSRMTPGTWIITRDHQEGVGGRVVEAKMKIEERLRKERRANQMERIRKPLLSTPGTPGAKRSRNAPEIWEGETPLEPGLSTGMEHDPAI